MPKDSRAKARANALPRERSPRTRRAVSQAYVRITAPGIAAAPDHLTAAAAPKAAPAANRQGRQIGEATGSRSPSAGADRSIHRRSNTSARNPTTTQSSRWASSNAVLDITTFRFSTPSRRPVTNVHSGLPKSSWAIAAVRTTARVPAIAVVTRHPKGRMPKALIPSAISHLPSGGCTHEPTSHLLVRQYRSSEDLTRQVLFDQPTRMHAAFG